MPRPKKTFDFPKWFDLKKYDDAENLDQEGWRLQFLTRVLMGMHWESEILDQEGKVEFPSDSEGLDKIRTQIREKGILARKDIPKGYFPGTNRDGVEMLTFPDLKNIVSNPLNETFSFHIGKGYLAVDLRLPWKVLASQLKPAIETLQRDYHKDLKKQITPKEWAKMRLLPYIDLRQWAKKVGASIPPGALARKLEIPEKRLNDLKRLMQKVLESRFLLQMAVIIPRES